MFQTGSQDQKLDHQVKLKENLNTLEVTFLAHLSLKVSFCDHILSMVRPSIHACVRNLLVWNQKVLIFDIWYVASSSGPLPKLFKL